MQCLFCGTPLALLRRLADGDFCSDGHRAGYYSEERAPLAGVRPGAPVAPRDQLREAALSPIALRAAVRLPGVAEPYEVTLAPHLATQVLRIDPPLPQLPAAGLRGAAQLLAANPQRPCLPACHLPALVPRMKGRPGEAAADFGKIAPRSWRPLIAGLRRSREAWAAASQPMRLLVATALPVLLALAILPEALLARHWSHLHKNIVKRAAIDFADDFRTGLDDWQSRSKLGANWSYDPAGFVRPGTLALYRPTLDLADYRFEFLGQVDQKSLGFVFRAADLDNYYAVRFVVAKAGPLPVVKVVRYAVINGREGAHIERPLPLPIRADMLSRVRLEARGSDFTLIIQGRVVDYWSDGRLTKGGVGFFCGRGERARLRWVEVSHQYDTLGRLCAYLAPYGGAMKNGS